jgi:hypothetical protein
MGLLDLPKAVCAVCPALFPGTELRESIEPRFEFDGLALSDLGPLTLSKARFVDFLTFALSFLKVDEDRSAMVMRARGKNEARQPRSSMFSFPQ